MEPKKDPKMDLRKKYWMFLNIGLVVAMCFMITAFEWKTFDETPHVYISKQNVDIETLLNIPITEMKPPAPKLVETKIKVVDDDEVLPEEKIEIDIDPEPETTEATFNDLPMNLGGLPDEEPDVFDGIVEEMPEPIEGMLEFQKYLSRNIKFPVQASKRNITGKVFLKFVIDKDGSIIEVEVLKGIGYGCDEEAIRVLKNSKKWKPGKQRGQPVKVRMIIPIYFRLG